MLRRFREAQEVLIGGGSDGGDGEALPWVMPVTWTPQYRELERCLHRLRDERPAWYRALRSRYVDPEIVTVVLPVSRGRVVYPANCEHDAGQPQIGDKTARVRVRRWPETLDQGAVDAGLRWLLVAYNDMPSLPPVMLSW